MYEKTHILYVYIYILRIIKVQEGTGIFVVGILSSDFFRDCVFNQLQIVVGYKLPC